MFQVPNFSGATHHSKHAFKYYSELDETHNRGNKGGVSFWPRGRVIGGTGAINGLLHIRGSEGDYKPWHLEEDDGWDWSTLREYFKKSENLIDPFIRNNPKLREEHGTEGPFIVDQLNFTHPGIVDSVTEAYQELGLKYLEDLSGNTQMGVGKIRGSNHKGKRVNTATAYLSTIKDRKNLRVLKNAFVRKIEFEGKTAKSVSVSLRYGDVEDYFATKEIIVSAGAVNTPVLLSVSGIGPKKVLKEKKIEVLADLPVGENLQDHVRIPVPVTIETGAAPRDEVFWKKALAEYLISQTGPYATNYDQLNINAFFSVPAGKELPDVQIDHNYFLPNTSYVYNACSNILSLKDEICDQFANFNSEKELIVFYVSLCRPYSKGRIEIRGQNPMEHPKIIPKYFSDKRDVDVYVNSLKRITEIVDTPTFKKFKGEVKRIQYPDCDGFTFRSDEYWECMARTVTYNVYHPVGTAKMGKANDPTSVVDSKLRVHGFKGLRVVDASVMPTIPSVNTNAAVMMVAERGADFIKAEYLDKKIKDEL